MSFLRNTVPKFVSIIPEDELTRVVKMSQPRKVWESHFGSGVFNAGYFVQLRNCLLLF